MAKDLAKKKDNNNFVVIDVRDIDEVAEDGTIEVLSVYRLRI